MKKAFSLLLIISFLGCSNSEKAQEIQTQIPLPFYNSADFSPEWIEESAEEYSSIHSIAPFAFEDQNGNTITNEDMQGKIYVADFFFTICPSICPKMTSNLSQVQEAFKQDSEVKILSYSVMPWVDSVAVLNSYAQLHNIDSNQWHLLTGNQQEIYDLARNSYFAEKEIGLSKSSEEFLHTENLILVDGRGRIRGVYNGTIPLEMNRLILDIKTLKSLG